MEKRSLFETVIFSVDAERVTVGDVLARAILRGEVGAWFSRFRSAIDSGLADEVVLGERVTAFRYARELIAAEDAENWLATRGLSLDDLADHFSRAAPDGCAVTRKSTEPPDNPHEAAECISAFSAPDNPAECAAFIRWLWFTEGMETLAVQESRRRLAAIGESTVGENTHLATDADLTESAIAATMTERLQASGWLATAQGAFSPTSQIPSAARAEAAWQAMRKTVLRPEALASALEKTGAGLTILTVDWLLLPHHEAAAEAILCLREDGLPPHVLARQCSLSHETETVFPSDLPDGWASHFVAAGAGDTLGPFADQDQFRVYKIRQKTAPDLNEIRVRKHLETELLDAFCRDRENGRLEWAL